MKKTQFTALRLSAAPFVIGVGLLAVATPAMAQDAAPASDDTDAGSAIIVTGSRIKQPNLESASPVTVIGAAEFAQTGTTRVEDLVNSLPQVFAGQGGGYSNGATGTATLDLRGLGSERTLVLVNGRRVVPGDPSSSAADINVIPAALIQRVDVLTGGASSVYGADAVSGVVNFVMDTTFEGFKLDTQYSVYNHDNRNKSKFTDPLNQRGFPYPRGMSTNGGTFDATLAFGAGFDDGRGHVTAYAGYRKINAVTQASRDYSACALSGRTAPQVQANGQLYTCGGSATSPQGTVFAFDSNDPRTSAFTSLTYQFGPNRTLLPGSTPYNFAPLNYFQRPDERYTAGVFADYEISEALHPYMEFMFMDDRTVAQIAPSGNFGNTLSLNCDNPLLSAAQLAVICDNENLLISTDPRDAFEVVGNNPGSTPANFYDPVTGAAYNRGFAQILRRNVEGGPRRDDLQHTSYRAVLGMRGDLSPAWSYDAYYQYGRTNFAETYTNDFSVARLQRALDVVDNPNTPGVVDPVCRSALDGTDPNCVPWDIFSPGTVATSDAATAYLSTPGFQRGIVSEQVLSAYISGALGEYGLKSPWADEGIGLVVGAEYRKESLEFLSDLAFSTGDLAGQGAATLPVSGSFNVKEVFTEVKLPIARNSWVYDFNITAGYRYSDYSTGNKTDTFKVEGEFAPIPDVRLRAGYNRAVRAPTIQDLFAPVRVALDGSSDPCAGSAITAAQTGCLAQGLVVGQTVAPNPAGQYNGLIGGNPNLRPEKADTYTVGIVMTPTFLPGFTASVDYFKIKLTDAIQGYGSDTIVGLCTQTADPTFCNLVHRDGSGSLWRTSNGYVENLPLNIGGVSTSGIDINAGYSREIGSAGRLGLTFVGTYLDKLETDTGIAQAGSYDCAGLYGNVCAPSPKWRHQARLSFDMPSGFGASLRWRYFSKVTLDAVDPNPNLNNTSNTGPAPGGVARPGLEKFDAISYFDLALTMKVGDHYNFRLGANNLFDKEPPTTGSQACPAGPCNGNVFASVYDALGRYIYAGITLDF
ncbi:TonB-dependent receptor domain-containing protein [Sphingopyxis terrae]|uniref:TonB-dependent Receptor Plug Domain n=1 Tax=Sphingopyxis terrae subsp. ummariensis TaxID=429001 RepID=A0A1Y6EYG9_9SPHN|nr:TonB-dependent receptor [Sphingopyxis terrae]SMQ65293.1 TonB-dependent Receptor Plug Domain [Sphingopyxis terrae subsp. ummariensis]